MASLQDAFKSNWYIIMKPKGSKLNGIDQMPWYHSTPSGSYIFYRNYSIIWHPFRMLSNLIDTSLLNPKGSIIYNIYQMPRYHFDPDGVVYFLRVNYSINMASLQDAFKSN